MSKTFIEILKSDPIEKFNPYHDRLGRFTTAGGATSFTYKPGQGAMYDNAIAREKQRTAGMGGGSGEIGTEQRPRKGLESGLGKEHAEAMEDIIKKAPENIQKVWDKYGDEITVANANGSSRGSCDYHGRITVNIASDSKENSFRNAYETTMHESGHSIDRAISRKFGSRFADRYDGGLFSKTIKAEAEKHVQRKVKELENDAEYKASHPHAFKKNGTVKIDYARAELGKELRKGSFKTTGDVSDMFEGATHGKVTGTGGHGKSYWNYHDVSTEAFAEMFSATTTNSESLGNIKKYFPESYKVFNEMMTYAGNL